MWRVIRILARGYSSAMLLVFNLEIPSRFFGFFPHPLCASAHTQDLLGSNLTVIRCNAAKLIETTCEATAGAAVDSVLTELTRQS
jgi:hypothetical protein